MGEVSTIGLDIAKSVFQVHGVDVDGTVVIRKRVSRTRVLEFFSTLPSCIVGIEACPSAHHWSRELRSLGHTVRLMPPSYVKAYLKRSKNDANDAAAICEAVTRPSMRFVPTKSEQQQSGLMLHRSRQLLVRQRTMLSNAIRGHLAELGIISAKGRNGTAELFKIIADEKDGRIPAAARFSLDVLARQHAAIAAEIGAIEKRIHAWHRSSEESRRLEQIPGVGPIVATALVSEVAIGKSSRPDEAWRPGSGLFPSSIRPAARNVWVESQNKVIGTCDGCSLQAPWPLYDMRDNTARGGSGLRVSWSAGRSRLPLLRLPIRSHAWPGR